MDELATRISILLIFDCGIFTTQQFLSFNMTCVPLAGNKRTCQFEVAVNLHNLMSVPYVNAVIFTKMRLLNSRKSRQLSPRYYLPYSVEFFSEFRL